MIDVTLFASPQLLPKPLAMLLMNDFVSLRAQVVVPCTVPTTRRMRWQGSVAVVVVRREGVRLGRISVEKSTGAVVGVGG